MRWKHTAAIFLAMLGIACILICYRHLAKHTGGFRDEPLTTVIADADAH
ncbi:hypothetical protein KIK06_15255 [Nocardiopsis sp. EMB25]|nr:hypothetical protein [Nocardiopsis sp. EMB25]MCY9785240.1 hypothetical protein [Nocardiopsis sp. EMB25]